MAHGEGGDGVDLRLEEQGSVICSCLQGCQVKGEVVGVEHGHQGLHVGLLLSSIQLGDNCPQGAVQHLDDTWDHFLYIKRRSWSHVKRGGLPFSAISIEFLQFKLSFKGTSKDWPAMSKASSNIGDSIDPIKQGATSPGNV